MTKHIQFAHPGEILQEEFLAELNITAYRVAKCIGVPTRRISGIVAGERSITADTALRLATFFGNSPEFWLNLQAHYDIEQAREELAGKLEQIRPLDADTPKPRPGRPALATAE